MITRVLAWLGLDWMDENGVKGSIEGDGMMKRVAIIGGGVGGATAAFFLKQSLGSRVHIDV